MTQIARVAGCLSLTHNSSPGRKAYSYAVLAELS